ncbi:hypothetical protein C8J56DRAFT_1056297 [Mycena floridula]|nr:hypothetical protein C8J56DRAFT_1056297 [Mycena floridula]
MFLRLFTVLAHAPQFARAYSVSALSKIVRRAAKENRGLRLGRLPKEVQEHHIRSRFEEFGKIESIVITPPAAVNLQVTDFAKAIVIFAQAGLVQRNLHELRKAGSVSILGQPAVIMPLRTTAAKFIRDARDYRQDVVGQERDTLYVAADITAEMSGEDIAKYFSPYGTVHRVSCVFSRYGGRGAIARFAPRSTIFELIEDSDGMVRIGGLECPISLLRTIAPIRERILMFRYVFPDPKTIIDPSAISFAESDIRKTLTSLDIVNKPSLIRTTRLSSVDNERYFRPRIIGDVNLDSLDEAGRIWAATSMGSCQITTPAGAWLHFMVHWQSKARLLDQREKR